MECKSRLHLNKPLTVTRGLESRWLVTIQSAALKKVRRQHRVYYWRTGCSRSMYWETRSKKCKTGLRWKELTLMRCKTVSIIINWLNKGFFIEQHQTLAVSLYSAGNKVLVACITLAVADISTILLWFQSTYLVCWIIFNYNSICSQHIVVLRPTVRASDPNPV